MRRAVFRRTTTGMALFPFLAVLICTMGSLIVLLVLILQNSRVQASVAGRSTTSSANGGVVDVKRPDPAAEKARQEQAELARRLRQEFEDHQWRREMLEAQRAEQLENLSRQRKELAHLEDHVRRLEDEWKKLNSQAKELQSLQDDKASEKASQEQAAAEELAKLKEQVEAKKKEVEEAKKKISDGPKSFALVPYIGKNGTRRRPIYVECTEGGIILHPEGVVFLPSDFQGPLGPGNPLDAALRTVREHWLRQPEAAREGEPYPLLIVRPNGAVAYSMARAAMKSWEEEFGYELVEEDLKLEFPPPDPELENLLTRSMKDARARQTVLAASMPSRYKNANQPVASTPAAGFAAAPYQDDGAPSPGRGTGAGFGAGAGGGGSMGGSSMGGSGAAGGTGATSGGAKSSGAPGGNGPSGSALGGSPPGGTANTAGPGQGPGPGPGAGGLGSGREGGTFLAGGAGNAGGNDSGAASGFGFGAGGGTGQGMNLDAGGGGPGAGGVAGGGGLGSGAGGGARGNGSPQEGAAPVDGDSPQAPGAQFVNAGPGAGGANGGANGGGRFQGGAAGAGAGPAGAGAGGAPGPGAFGGGSNGFGASNGATMSGPEGAPPPNATGDTRGGASSSGSNMSDGSGQASTTFSTKTSNAKVRQTGPDWALRNKTHSATAITRPIRIRCLVDRLVILPEKGDDQRQQVIPTPGGAQAAVEPFVTAIWRQTDRWGLAVSNGYWKPVLNVEVGPGAENNFRQLEAALQGSGLEVIRK